MTIWIDVDDLMEFFRNAATPTGIQRLSFETCRAVWAQAGKGGKIGFCRQSARRMGFRAISFPALEAVIMQGGRIAPGHAEMMPELTRPAKGPIARRLLRRLRALPPQFRRPLAALRMAGSLALLAARDFALACLHPAIRQPGRSDFPRDDAFDLGSADIVFAQGDWLVCLGAGWNRPYAADLLQALRARGAQFAVLVYDLIPELFPEWCQYAVVQDFRHWLRHVVPQATRVFAISRQTSADLAECMAGLGFDIPEPVVLPIGSHRATATATATAAVASSRPYVLMVGTIEIRKNHAALLRVWRRLLRNPPPGGVPELVFAGKPGWLTGDVMQQLRDTGGLGGYIRLVDAPSEAALAALYAGCLFTVFPAFYEGWGLPVTESLCHGKAVAASRNAAIPEAGGPFCAYFDPDDVGEMYNVIRGLIEQPGQVAALEALIAEQFRPPGWGDAAACLISALEQNSVKLNRKVLFN